MTKLAETSITRAASRVDFIEKPESWTPIGNISLGRGFERQDFADLFGFQPTTAKVNSYLLHNTHLDTACMTLIKDQLKIRETNYLVPPEYYENANIIENNIVKLDPSVHYVMARGFQNYYHWLVQSVPAIDWALRDRSADGVALLTGDLNRWQMEFLTILGYQNVPRIALNPANHYSIPSVTYSDFQNGSTAFAVSMAAHRTFQNLVHLAGDATTENTDLIYVARTDTSNRVAANEDEVMYRLEKEGVRIVVPGKLTVVQQINLFSRAYAVIGPHGAGLTNIAFCRPGTVFYELLPRHYLNACFNRLAQAAQLEYTADLFDADGPPTSDPHLRGWKLEPDFIVERVREIRKKVATLRPRSIQVAYHSPAMDYLTGKASSPPQPRAGTQPPGDSHQAPQRGWLRRILRLR